ncbi:DUF6950 family protein [Caulobacter hibisci]|uniref:DUF6950 domain-containing protein n=1 Tax=Caulobacter hibisci TaxID=2035993 RepID=A0ABS0SSQ6_9CAUL|nr:hypothetical protein [Caulobacter hibisci]MBI1682394.1 hypothetical protein [Caulobacter hibisci]
MSDIAKRLAVYLAWAARQPFSYERGWDCASGLVARWVEQERGTDPAAPWRGRYSTALGCARLVRREGGMHAIMGFGLAAVGLARTETPQVGDVGLVMQVTPAGPEPVAAIRTRRRWVMLTATGLRASIRARCIAAWSLS